MTADMPAARILIVEAETTIARFMSDALKEEGFTVFIEGTLKEGLTACSTRQPDLVVVDLGLPDGDGLDLIGSFRTFSTAPVIVLSARTDEKNKIQALDLGADDYIAKPFGMGELLVCVRAQLRRRALINPETPEPAVDIGDVHVDLGARTVTKNGEPVHLTKLEYRLLQILIESRGKVLTQRQLLQRVWGPAYVERPHYLRIYMSRLRAKLEDDPARPKWAWGAGSHSEVLTACREGFGLCGVNGVACGLGGSSGSLGKHFVLARVKNCAA